MNMHIVFKISISNLPFSSPIKVKHRLRLIILDTNESHVRDSFIVARQEADSTNFPTDLFRLFFFITSKFITYFKYGFIDTPLWSARLVYLRVPRSYETKVDGADCARNRRGGSDIWRGEPVSSLGGTGASEIETRREMISFFPTVFRWMHLADTWVEWRSSLER